MDATNSLKAELLRGEKWLKELKPSSFNRKNYFLLGKTGAGKTTLLNYLKGNKLKKINIERGPVIDLDDKYGHKMKGEPEIGHGNQSQTHLPNVYDSFIDCGGLEDNRSAVICISNQCLIRELILKSQSCSFIFVVKFSELDYARTEGMKEFKDYVEKIYGSLKEAQEKRKSFLMIVTSIPEGITLPMVKNRIKEFDKDGLFKGRIETYDPLNELGRDQLRVTINELEGVHLQDTQIKITDAKMRILDETYEEIRSSIKSVFQKFFFKDENNLDEVKELIGCIKIISSLNNMDIKHLNKRFFENFVLMFKNEFQKKVSLMIKSGDFEKINNFLSYLSITIKDWDFPAEFDHIELQEFVEELFQNIIDQRESLKEKEFLRSQLEKTKAEIEKLNKANENFREEILALKNFETDYKSKIIDLNSSI